MCGEIMSYTDLHEHGSEAAVKAAGKLKQQGKTYESASPGCPRSTRDTDSDTLCSGRRRHRVLEVWRVGHAAFACSIIRTYTLDGTSPPATYFMFRGCRFVYSAAVQYNQSQLELSGGCTAQGAGVVWCTRSRPCLVTAGEPTREAHTTHILRSNNYCIV